MKSFVEYVSRSGLLLHAENLYTLLPRTIKRGRAFSPKSLVYIGNYSCNARCVHCLYHGKTAHNKTREIMRKRELQLLNVYQIDQMLREARNMGVIAFSLHGGEPTLFDYFAYTMRTAKQLGMHTAFFTNGTIDVDDLEWENIDEIKFSVEGLRQQHADITGIDSLNTVMYNISRVPVSTMLSVNTTIQSLNVDVIADMAPMLYALGVREWTIQLPFLTESTDSSVTAVNIPKFIEQINILRYRHYSMNITLPSKAAIKAYPHYKGMRWCNGLYTRMYINPYGDMVPCVSMSPDERLTFGNIKDTSLNTLWNGHKFREYRNNMNCSELPDDCKHCCMLDRGQHV